MNLSRDELETSIKELKKSESLCSKIVSECDRWLNPQEMKKLENTILKKGVPVTANLKKVQNMIILVRSSNGLTYLDELKKVDYSKGIHIDETQSPRLAEVWFSDAYGYGGSKALETMNKETEQILAILSSPETLVDNFLKK